MVTAGARPDPTVSAAGGYETSPESPVVIRFELSLPIETARKRSYRILEAAKLADTARIGVNEASWRVYSQIRNAWMDHQLAVDAVQALSHEAQIRAEIAAATSSLFELAPRKLVVTFFWARPKHTETVMTIFSFSRSSGFTHPWRQSNPKPTH